MRDLPVILRLRGKRCVVVGGGSVAERRARALLDSGARVEVIAPEVSPWLVGSDAVIYRRMYRAGDLQAAALVVAATDDAAVNAAVADEARRVGALLNRADDPEAGDIVIPAVGRRGPVTVAVDTGGASASAAARIRDELLGALDPAWVELLEVAAPMRAEIQARFEPGPARTARLRRLTDAEARHILKARGRVALREHLAQCLAESDGPDPSDRTRGARTD